MAEEDGLEVADLQAELQRLHARQARIHRELVDNVRAVHDEIIRVSGGVLGEKTGALESALARPFLILNGEPMYPTLLDQAAVVFHGLICGHAFADGSKRTGTMIAAAIIEIEIGVDATTSDQILQLEEIALEAAMPGGMAVSEIARRFRLVYPNAIH